MDMNLTEHRLYEVFAYIKKGKDKTSKADLRLNLKEFI